MNISNGFVDLFVKTTSEAAYASSLLKGKGDKIAADQAAVDKMRLFLNNIPLKGKIVIGEGEMDEAPYISKHLCDVHSVWYICIRYECRD